MKSNNKMKICRLTTLMIIAFFAMNCQGYHYYMDMSFSPSIDSQQKDNLGNRIGNRLPPENTVPFGKTPLHLGMNIPADYEKSDRELKNPLEDSLATLELGKERYNIYCFPCHGMAGKSDGPVTRVWKGIRPIVRIDNQPLPLEKYGEGRIFHVISTGFVSMPGYASQIPVNERWAIAKYVKILQKNAMQ